MLSLLRIPKVQLLITLLLISVCAFIQYPTLSTLSHLFLTLAFTVLFDLIFTYIRRKTFFIPYAAMVTGLILGLLISPEANIMSIAAASAVAIGVKNFVRFSGRHIFNPAASGLFIIGLLFGEYTAWWGVSFQTLHSLTSQSLLFFIILLSPGLVSIMRLRKHYMIATFLLFAALIPQLRSLSFSLPSIINTMIDPTFAFFALTMLPEPMTSPATLRNQVLFGLTVAILSFLIPTLLTSIFETSLAIDPFTTALLLGNLAFFKNR